MTFTIMFSISPDLPSNEDDVHSCSLHNELYFQFPCNRNRLLLATMIHRI